MNTNFIFLMIHGCLYFFRCILVFLPIFVFLLFLSHCTPGSPSSFELKVSIKGLKKGVVVLQTLKNGELVDLDTSFVERERAFYFEGKLSQPKLFWITVVKKESDRIPIFLEPGQVSLNAHIDSLVFPRIKGSSSHNFYQTYRKTIRYFSLREADLIKKKILAYKSKRLDKLKHISKRELDNRRNKMGYLANFVIAHPNSAVSGYIALENLSQLSPFMIDTISSVLAGSASKSIYIKSFLDIVNSLKNTKVGKPFPPGIDQPLLDGGTLNISNLKGAKLILFWSIKNQNAIRLRDKLAMVSPGLKKAGVQVIAIALETNRKVWQASVKLHPIDGSYEASDLKGMNNQVIKAMSVINIPHIILVNTDGTIVWREADFQDETSILQLLKLHTDRNKEK